MLRSERLERIEEYINHNRYVTIPQLAQAFGISASTIRRDLDLPEEVRMVPFSAEKGFGKEELIGLLNAACEK